MPEEDCNNCRKYDFGEGFEHVRSIILNDKTYINTGFTHKYGTIMINAFKILSGS